MSEKKWLADRVRGVGGSESAAILGLSPFLSNQELFKIKTGQGKKRDFAKFAEFIEYGKKCEPLIRGLFEADFTQLKVEYKDWDSIQNPQHKFILGTIDGRLTDENGRKGFLEIKTSAIFTGLQAMKWEKNQIPQNYFVQVCHYFLAEPEFQFCKFRALVKSTNRIEIKDYHFERSDLTDSIDYLRQEIIKFWGFVERNEMPPLRLPSI